MHAWVKLSSDRLAVVGVDHAASGAVRNQAIAGAECATG
jgi:hypothetical protein